MYISSVTEVEVIVGVVIILALTKERSYEVEGEWHPSDTEPYSESEISDPPLDKETLCTTVHKVEQPLLGGVGPMMPDVATSVG